MAYGALNAHANDSLLEATHKGCLHLGEGIFLSMRKGSISESGMRSKACHTVLFAA